MPKPNGYQSLHTVVRDGRQPSKSDPYPGHARTRRARRGRALGLQRRLVPRAMRACLPTGDYDAKIAVLRQLLGVGRDAWRAPCQQIAPVRRPHLRATPVQWWSKGDAGGLCLCRAHQPGPPPAGARSMAPWCRSIRHCRTARRWNHPTVRKGALARRLNADLGYLTSNRAKAKVRAWFNAQATHETVARGREAVEKLLQREGKTAMKLDDLAPSWASSRPMRCLKWWARDEFRCATSKPAAPARACCSRTSIPAAQKPAQRMHPKAGCWWWASIH